MFFPFFRYLQQHWETQTVTFVRKLLSVVDKQTVHPLSGPHNTAEEIISLLLTYI